AAFAAISGAVSVGVSLASNEISDDMEVYVADVTHTLNATSGGVTVSATEGATINAIGSAGSVAISGGGIAVSVAGAGIEVSNVVLTKTNAYLSNDVLTASGDVGVNAANTSTINAIVTAISGAGAFGAGAVAAAAGAAVAQNFIGYDALGAKHANEVQAYASNTSVSTTGKFS